MHGRLGAYLLPGDPVWLRSSLSRYYDLLDDLVVLVPEDGLGWTGKPLPVSECVAVVESVDTRGISRAVVGRWRDDSNPMAADTAQRQAGIDALSGSVDWILQIDNDEVLPEPRALVESIETAGSARGIEWPMLVLYRRIGHRYLGVVGEDGRAAYEYPGSIAVRAGSRLVDARRVSGPFVRRVIDGDVQSFQLKQPRGDDETRVDGLTVEQAIIHNSWAKSPREVWRKTRSWGHAAGLRGTVYFLTRWLPAPLTWRRMRDFHPFARGLWSRLAPVDVPDELVLPEDRTPTRIAWRSPARR